MPDLPGNAIARADGSVGTAGRPGAPAPIIVSAELEGEAQAWAEGLRRRFYLPERNKVPAHVTLFRHLPPSLENELRRLLAEFAAEPPPRARIGTPYALDGGVAIVLESPDLLDLHAHLRARFDHHLTPQDDHPPRLHITIQNKVAPDVARATLALLRQTVRPRPVRIAALACWHYRDGRWDLIARYAFRGRG
ncbi:2'-5' RNA ligase family protein [Sphingobium lignivorans]|uniref:2'-5' RNA ligase family protein n=1 Tax=Sphingobium lignivorans TaxID=2735886 RepID=A0ABR6NFN6_9SPHN|nr:hypothetical protein [Sphingobium lignivorans]